MKIKLLTIWHSANYGAELQTYATVRALQEMQHEVEVIDFRLQDRPRRTTLVGQVLDFMHDCSPVNQKFKHFWDSYIPSTRHYHTMEELINDPPQAELYIVGSDQVWNPQITKDKASAYFLCFAPEGMSMASYASSIGTDKWLGDAELTEIAAKQLKRFKGISCRESQGCMILRDIFQLQAEHVLDPSLLHSSYPELTGHVRQKSTLAYYQLSDNPVLMAFSKQKAKDMKLMFVDVNHQSQITPTFSWNRRSVGQWIKTIAESRFVITHSFHGVALCLLYHRPFVAIYDNGNKISRLVSLLQMVGLENRLFTSIDDASHSNVWEEPIDYHAVDENLVVLREHSVNYLKRITQE